MNQDQNWNTTRLATASIGRQPIRKNEAKFLLIAVLALVIPFGIWLWSQPALYESHVAMEIKPNPKSR